MTAELTWLLATMILAGSMWIPYVVGVNLHLPEGIDAFQRPYDNAVLPDWVQRAYRAHLNLLEQAMPFAVVVIVAHLAGVSNVVTVWASAAFFALRVVHAAGMIMGWARDRIRPTVFTAGWVCILLVAGATLVG